LVLVGHLRMGAVGSALATFVVLAAGEPLLQLPLGLKMAGVPLGRWCRAALLPGFGPAAAGAAVWLFLQHAVRPAGFAALSACVLAGAGVYLAVLGRFALQEDDRRDLKGVLVACRMRLQRRDRKAPAPAAREVIA